MEHTHRSTLNVCIRVNAILLEENQMYLLVRLYNVNLPLKTDQG